MADVKNCEDVTRYKIERSKWRSEAKQSFLLSYVQRSDAGRIRGGWESLEDYSGASFTKILILIFFQVYNLEWFELEEC